MRPGSPPPRFCRIPGPLCKASLCADTSKHGAVAEEGDDPEDLAQLQVPLEEMFEDLTIEESAAPPPAGTSGVQLDEGDMDL